MLNAWGLVFGLMGLISAVVVAVVRFKRSGTGASSRNFKPFANTESIRELPEYKAAKKKYHLLVGVLLGLMVIAISATSVLTARPASVTTAKPNYENRDIMFCIDVSGSMNEYIKELLEYYSNVIKKFEGQRVGLTIFDGVYMNLSPLSDDYDAVSDLLADVSKDTFSYSSMLSMVQQSSSEIGPGLVGCVNSFDKLGEEDRSRSIIFSTDNYASETQTVSLAEAANYAKRYDIAIYGLSTSDWRTQAEIDNLDETKYESDRDREFRESMLSTGGAYFTFSKYSDNTAAVKKIAEQILEQSAARYDGNDTLVYKDSPLIATIVVVVSLAGVAFIMWRFGL